MKTKILLKTILFATFLCPFFDLKASQLPIPRFVSTRYNEVNIRSGPGLRYPIVWVYKQNNMPLEIIGEFDVWRKVKDIDGDEGWVNKNMLTGRRNFMVSNESGAFLYQKEVKGFVKMAILEQGVMGKIIKCHSLDDYCYVNVSDFEGFIKRLDIFGVYNYEDVD
ncbi:MAG: Bacterial SH3 domain protein [Alphaproteobacteria bacterium ADurb.Bin438]|nr:MAG: Bacterial SH3 domain protein [Alphaproteobacteria bacterium ADurb.Bin438]